MRFKINTLLSSFSHSTNINSEIELAPHERSYEISQQGSQMDIFESLRNLIGSQNDQEPEIIIALGVDQQLGTIIVNIVKPKREKQHANNTKYKNELKSLLKQYQDQHNKFISQNYKNIASKSFKKIYSLEPIFQDQKNSLDSTPEQSQILECQPKARSLSEDTNSSQQGCHDQMTDHSTRNEVFFPSSILQID